MIEEVTHVFGSEDRLVGISTRLAAGRPKLGVVLINAGVIHRVGPHRSSVKLARALAPLGAVVLRFDLSGVGDSQLSTRALPYHEQAVEDVRDALDMLRGEFGVQRFVVFGICSGAVHACSTALADDRVVGVVLFDGYAYPTWKTPIATAWAMARVLPPRQLLSKVWKQTQKRWQAWLEPASASSTPGLPASALAPMAVPNSVASTVDVPVDASGLSRADTTRNPAVTGGPTLTQLQFRSVMQTLIARGVQVYLIYSGSVREVYSYTHQLRDNFGRNSFLRHIRYDFFPDLDHTLTTLAGQRQIEQTMRHWVATRMLGEPEPAPQAETDTRPTAYYNDRRSAG
jgi:pimeloyl-ACP methyl ester carboxylesterase